MPSFYEITQAAQRTVELDLHGFKIKIVESLHRKPDEEREARTQMQKALDEYDRIVLEARNAKEDDALAISAVEMSTLKTQLLQDQRRRYCVNLHSRIVSWDLTDGTKKIKTDADSLYNSDIPTGLLEKIVIGLNNEPIVPNESTSP